MTDDAVDAPWDPENAHPDDATTKPPQKMDPAFYAALALVGILVLLIVVINVPGIRTSAGITLTKPTWTLQSYANENGELVPVISGTQVTARFGSDGALRGSAGCNNYAATYTTRNLAITISPATTTLMFCENSGIMQQESAYIKDLEKAVELRVSESNLNLYDKTGKPLLVFEALV